MLSLLIENGFDLSAKLVARFIGLLDFCQGGSRLIAVGSLGKSRPTFNMAFNNEDFW